MESVVTILLSLLGIYLLVGLVFYFPFIIKGVKKIDDGAKETSISFKLLMIPGVMAFWPVLMRKWFSSKSS